MVALARAKSSKAQATINSYLIAFLEKSFRDLDYSIRVCLCLVDQL